MPMVAELVDSQGVSITFSREQYERLKDLAKKERRTLAYLVRVAVDQAYPPHADTEREERTA